MKNYQGTVFGKLKIPLHVFHEEISGWGVGDVSINYEADPNLFTWNEERKQFLYSPNNDLRIPEDIRAYIRPLVEKRREESVKRGAAFFDGQMVRLADWGIRIEEKDAETEKTKLILSLAPTAFFTYMATNRSYDETVLKDDKNMPVSMRNKYGIDVCNLKDWMANSIGVSTTLISQPSGAIMMVERSEKLVNIQVYMELQLLDLWIELEMLFTINQIHSQP